MHPRNRLFLFLSRPSHSVIPKRQSSPFHLRQRHPTSSRPLSSTPTMAKEFKLKGISDLNLDDGQMKEADVEGLEEVKVLLINSQGTVHATGPKCTHFGAPLKNGVLGSDGRLTCPWHGACFNVKSGDVEDAPALDPIAKFELVQKDGAVYVRGDEETIKAGRIPLNISCSSHDKERVVVIGGGSATLGITEQLRKDGYKGAITVLSKEPRPFDRTKLSKALLSDISKAAWRSPDFYKSASIDIKQEEVTTVDFDKKTVKTSSGQDYTYTTLVLASGGDPKSLPLTGLKAGELGNVFLLRSLEHTKAINDALGDKPKKVVVIGSSFIGMEAAGSLAGQKHDVTVIGMESEPCENVFGKKIGATFRGLLEKNGVKFKMSASVSHASPSQSDGKKVGAVHLKDGTELPADVVIEGVGVGPATNYLKEAVGGPSLEKDGSITVDENFRVPSLSNVYAVGDIATYPYNGRNVRIEHWNVAQNAGRNVARHLTGKPVRKFTPVFWSAMGMQLRYCGNTAGGYDDVIINGNIDVSGDKQPSFAAFYVRGDEVVAVATMGKDPVMVQVAELMRTGKMLSRREIEGGRDVLGVKL